MVYEDQLGRSIGLNYPPKRIISVVPSQTELLYDLGLEDEVIGITKFCIHPDKWYREKTRIGGTKALNIEKIKALNPDLIIANKEENEHAQIAELSKHFPVWISDIKTLDDSLDMIKRIGIITDREQKSAIISNQIKESFEAFPPIYRNEHLRCAYFIWWNPMMSVNADTFINDMLMRCGWNNVFAARTNSRYPEVSDDELKAANPQLVLLSSEPFPFAEKHIAHFQQLLPEAQVVLVDGEMFSWYGSRLLQSVNYFKELQQSLRSSS